MKDTFECALFSFYILFLLHNISRIEKEDSDEIPSDLNLTFTLCVESLPDTSHEGFLI